MAKASDSPLHFKDLRGGRNGGDPPLSIDPDQVNEALNVDYRDGTIAAKRLGSVSISLAFSAGGPFGSGVKALGRHVPAAVETDAELWGVDGANLIGRMAGGVAWVAPTLKDALTSSPSDWLGYSFNSKMPQFYKSAVNRAHLWDGSTVRRMGLGCPTGTPTVVEAGGAVTDNRKYRATVIKKTGTTIDLRSELNETATGVRTLIAEQATVTLVGAPGEGESHWELWGASDDDNYATYRYISEAAIGVDIVDNNPALTGLAAALTGTYLVPPSAKYSIADDARVVMAGAWETTATYGQVTPKNNRVWWTPVLGDLDISDDERIVITTAIRNYLDVTLPITGIGGPIFGSPYVFSYRSIWRFAPTGVVDAPYRRIPLGVPFGCIHHKSICLGEDEDGRPALYFASHLGIYRISVNGIEYCFWDNQDIWDTVNLAATVPVHCVYHSDRHQLWVHLATGSNDFPNERFVFHTRFGQSTVREGVVKGWSRHTGLAPAAACSTMFANTLGASMSRDLKPYVGTSANTIIFKGDASGTTQDDVTPYQAYVEKSVAPVPGAKYKVGPGYITADPGVGVSLQQTITPDFGVTAGKAVSVSLTPKGVETKVFVQAEDGILGGLSKSCTLRLGDAVAVANTWNIDEWELPVTVEELLK